MFLFGEKGKKPTLPTLCTIYLGNLQRPLPLQYHDICRVRVAVVDTAILGAGRAVDVLLASRLYAECCGFVIC